VAPAAAAQRLYQIDDRVWLPVVIEGDVDHGEVPRTVVDRCVPSLGRRLGLQDAAGIVVDQLLGQDLIWRRCGSAVASRTVVTAGRPTLVDGPISAMSPWPDPGAKGAR